MWFTALGVAGLFFGLAKPGLCNREKRAEGDRRVRLTLRGEIGFDGGMRSRDACRAPLTR